jgi:hypothetical protein
VGDHLIVDGAGHGEHGGTTLEDAGP